MNSSEEPKYTSVVIEYCPGCRWLLRSSWMAQEILTTFETEIDEVRLRPAEVNQVVSELPAKMKCCGAEKETAGFPR